jgi:hypothetical protein
MALVAAGVGVSIVPEIEVEEKPGCRFILTSPTEGYRGIGIAQLC